MQKIGAYILKIIQAEFRNTNKLTEYFSDFIDFVTKNFLDY